MMRDLFSATRFELSRMLAPVAVAIAVACAGLSIAEGYATLENHARLIQSVGSGATAQDVFLGVLSSTNAVACFLPMGVVLLTGRSMGDDTAGGLRDVPLVRLRHRGAWWGGKVVATVVASVGLLLATCVLSWAYDALANGMPMSDGAMPAWLTYPGGASAAPAELYTQMLPLPDGWNVYALELGLVVLYGLLYAGFSLLLQAVCMGSQSPWATPVLAMGVLAVLQLTDMLQSLGFTYESLAWLAQVSHWRLPVGHLLLSGYPLGSGPWADTLTMQSLYEPGPVTVGLNSEASALALTGLLLVGAVVLGAWRSREGCVHLGPCGKGTV